MNDKLLYRISSTNKIFLHPHKDKFHMDLLLKSVREKHKVLQFSLVEWKAYQRLVF